jgi:hypothetical protein
MVNVLGQEVPVAFKDRDREKRTDLLEHRRVGIAAWFGFNPFA